MKIGIIGAGNVGGTLGARWERNGHSVAFGVRDPNSTASRDLLQKAGSGTATTVADAARSGDVLVLSTPWGVTQQAIESLGYLAGKIVIDVTNPVLPDLSGLSLGTTTSAAEQVAQWHPVRAWSKHSTQSDST
jgi:8-hydroxy-5-deazaflavin:NADPH oxidoreductase